MPSYWPAWCHVVQPFSRPQETKWLNRLESDVTFPLVPSRPAPPSLCEPSLRESIRLACADTHPIQSSGGGSVSANRRAREAGFLSQYRIKGRANSPPFTLNASVLDTPCLQLDIYTFFVTFLDYISICFRLERVRELLRGPKLNLAICPFALY